MDERMEDEEVEVLERFGMAYVSGDLPAWFYRLWLSLQTVPLYKTAQQVDMRPLGVRHSLTRVIHREVVSQNKQEVREFLEPQQLGQSQAGAAKLIHSIRGLLSQHPDWVCIAADIKNCYNEFSRRAVLNVILSAPELAHLATFSAAILAPVNALESAGEVWGSTGMGLCQGDPMSGMLQAIGMQPDLVELDMECLQGGGGVARAGADDVFALGPPEVALPAMARFGGEV